jgi:hypothetical protein
MPTESSREPLLRWGGTRCRRPCTRVEEVLLGPWDAPTTRLSDRTICPLVNNARDRHIVVFEHHHVTVAMNADFLESDEIYVCANLC